MDVTEAASERTRPTHNSRPAPCPRCKGSTWWDGWRQVFPRTPLGRVEVWLPRAKCKRGCPSFVESRPGDLYPHRQYQPDTVAGVVAAVALGGVAHAKAATSVTASATSARRWTRWVSSLLEVATALAWAGRMWPEGEPGVGISSSPGNSTRATAARVLHALESLGEALVHTGVALASRTGLGRFLEWQLREHGDVVHLVAPPTCFSPAMALSAPGGPR